jgi:hypothetical protein
MPGDILGEVKFSPRPSRYLPREGDADEGDHFADPTRSLPTGVPTHRGARWDGCGRRDRAGRRLALRHVCARERDVRLGRRVEENGSGGVDHGFGRVVMMLGGGVKGGQVHGRWPGLAEANLLDGDLNGVNDHRWILAEVLEKRCRAGSVSDIFPGISSDRLDVVGARP